MFGSIGRNLRSRGKARAVALAVCGGALLVAATLLLAWIVSYIQPAGIRWTSADRRASSITNEGILSYHGNMTHWKEIDPVPPRVDWSAISDRRRVFLGLRDTPFEGGMPIPERAEEFNIGRDTIYVYPHSLLLWVLFLEFPSLCLAGYSTLIAWQKWRVRTGSIS